MSATYFVGKIKYTKRYHLGQELSKITRHFLLMTATPLNGKEADFQLFMGLLKGNLFDQYPPKGEGRTGVQDPGCTVAYLIVKGFHRVPDSE